jgi:hypothetical protein
LVSSSTSQGLSGTWRESTARPIVYEGAVVKKLIAGALIGAGLGLGLGFAAPAQAAPCELNGKTQTGSGRGGPMCGLPDLQKSVNNSVENLKKNLQKSTDVGTAMKNLQHNLTHGVGSEDTK